MNLLKRCKQICQNRAGSISEYLILPAASASVFTTVFLPKYTEMIEKLTDHVISVLNSIIV